MQEKFYEIETTLERFEGIIKSEYGGSFFRLEKGFVGNLPGMGVNGRTFHVIDLVQIDTETFKEKGRTPLAHYVGEQTDEMLQEECQIIMEYTQKLYEVLRSINELLTNNPHAKEELELENQRKTLLKGLTDILSLDREGRVAALKVDRFTKYPKESQYFVEAKIKDELPYGVTQAGEEILICPFSVQFEDENEKTEAIEYTVSWTNRLVDIRTQREKLAGN